MLTTILLLLAIMALGAGYAHQLDERAKQRRFQQNLDIWKDWVNVDHRSINRLEVDDDR